MYLLLSLLSLWQPLLQHDFHTSITEAHFNTQSGNLEVSIKVFTDDLENHLQARYQHKIRFSETTRTNTTDSILTIFLKEHFSVVNGNKSVIFSYLGLEHEKDITYLYLEGLNQNPQSQVTLRNTIFIDDFNDQANIVNARVNGDWHSVFLNKNKPQQVLRFD